MSPRYALGIRPSSPAHIGGASGRTLCGLSLDIFGSPLRPEAVKEHETCRTCEGVRAALARWRERVPA